MTATFIRIARLATEDPAYENGARWAVLEPLWLGPDLVITGSKVRSLEEAIALGEAVASGRSVTAGAREFTLATDPAPISAQQTQLETYRARRAAGHTPPPPAAWSDIFAGMEEPRP